MRWTKLLLQPMSSAARYMMLTQLGADGLRATTKQTLADAFSQNFDDPAVLADRLRDFGATRRWVTDVVGKSADLEAAKGLLQVGVRQLRNSWRPEPIGRRSHSAYGHSILAGRDVIAQAKTGSGETAALRLGMLQRLTPS